MEAIRSGNSASIRELAERLTAIVRDWFWDCQVQCQFEDLVAEPVHEPCFFGQRKELARVKQPTLWVVPTDERR
ncbi:hypothetical protein QFZ60_002214 [Arthrobacter sp. B2I5]|nr:hypothetical protein [Arthrobacter sp. B2I5]